ACAETRRRRAGDRGEPLQPVVLRAHDQEARARALYARTFPRARTRDVRRRALGSVRSALRASAQPAPGGAARGRGGPRAPAAVPAAALVQLRRRDGLTCTRSSRTASRKVPPRRSAITSSPAAPT